jgi:hypothetical protein
VIAAAAVPPLACAVCFGGAESPLVDGARAGAFMLIGVTVLMQGSLAGFFFYLRRRARRTRSRALDREWSALQHQATRRT